MKKLQRNYTTPKQSKQLLDLGVPEWTADCCFSKSKDGEYICEGVKHIIPDDFCVQSVPFPAYPCWSVGRLMEIYEIVGENAGQCVTTTKGTSRIENLVKLYEENATLLDFSKLEE
jgi:hypothetical protein